MAISLCMHYFPNATFIYTNYKLALFGKIMLMPIWGFMNMEIFIMKREVLWDIKF